MKKLATRLALLLMSVLLLPMAAAAKHDHGGLADTTVLIIRHAEKPQEGSGLTPEGEARAEAYVKYFQRFSVNGESVRPDTLIAAADSSESQRPRLTLEPLGKALGLSIDERFSDKQAKELAKALRSSQHGRYVLICWHHGDIPKLIRELDGNSAELLPKDKWPSNVFGWVVLLRYDHEGRLIPDASQVIHEHLMPDDS
jgi:hypothetical protein